MTSSPHAWLLALAFVAPSSLPSLRPNPPRYRVTTPLPHRRSARWKRVSIAA